MAFREQTGPLIRPTNFFGQRKASLLQRRLGDQNDCPIQLGGGWHHRPRGGQQCALGWAQPHKRPIRSRTIKMITTKPSPPLGP
jgi:hypothetical protein